MNTLVDNLIESTVTKKKKRKRRKETQNSTKRRNRRSKFLQVDPNCFYCRKSLTLETSTLDHVIPVCMGGGIKDNLVLACYSCNNKKGKKIKDIDMNSVLEINKKVERLNAICLL